MKTLPDVLNPTLYRRLLRVFGAVKVGHPGEARVVRQNSLGDEPALTVLQHGEQYFVRCCFCRDRGQRLSINHLYGQRDASGRQLLYRAYCHASNCLANPEHRADLAQKLSAHDDWLERASIKRGTVSSPREFPVELPEPRTRLDRLKKGHPARRHLLRGGFDPDKLARVYGLCYCGPAAPRG